MILGWHCDHPHSEERHLHEDTETYTGERHESQCGAPGHVRGGPALCVLQPGPGQGCQTGEMDRQSRGMNAL